MLSSELQAEILGFGSQKGIYKPAGSTYALWVRQTAKGLYPDREVETHPDGSWTYQYSPEGRGGRIDLDLDTNKALQNAIVDRVPVGVFRQANDEAGKSAYEVLGLAYVESFDGTHFHLRGEAIDIEASPRSDQGVRPFEPFDVEFAERKPVFRTDRDRRFGVVVRRIYHSRCSLCNIGFRLRGDSVGLEAAHIIPVEKRGTLGDIRNGILLCSNHHTLFDQNAWTIDEELRIRLAPDEDLRVSAVANHLVAAEGKRLTNLPAFAEDYPAPEAIKWRLAEFERAWGVS